MKYGSVRIVKQEISKSVKSGNKNYRSYISQYQHDFRIEKMEEGYLKRPNEENKYHKFYKCDSEKEIIDMWEHCNYLHKKEHNKKIQKQTKPTLNFLISFSKDFDLNEEDRQKQFEVVKKFIQEHYSIPLYLVQHNDEKSLHYTFSIINFDKNEKRPLGKRLDTSLLQDLVFDYLKQHNVDYGHTRGETKSITMKEHKTIMEGKVQELKEQEQKLKEEIETLKFSNEKLKEENKKLQEDKIELKNNIVSVHNQGLTYLEDLLNDFIELGLNYKGKDTNSLVELFNRYLKGDKQKKLEELTLKLKKIVIKERKKSNNYLQP